MNNDDAYAKGLLNRALDPVTQPPEIQSFLRAETELLRTLIPTASRVIDFGCGMGRHLIALSDHIGDGVGIDYEAAYIAEAKRIAGSRFRFIEADATAVPLDETFDFAICMTNSWGTMSDKLAVVDEMKRLSPSSGSRLITAYASASAAARSQWYANMGNDVLEVTDTQVVASGGFSSEHFAEERLRALLRECQLHEIGDIAYMAQFLKLDFVQLLGGGTAAVYIPSRLREGQPSQRQGGFGDVMLVRIVRCKPATLTQCH